MKFSQIDSKMKLDQSKFLKITENLSKLMNIIIRQLPTKCNLYSLKFFPKWKHPDWYACSSCMLMIEKLDISLCLRGN